MKSNANLDEDVVRLDDEREKQLPRPPNYTDEALALLFAARHVRNLRFVAAWSRWLVWDGARWQTDDTLRAFDLARKICREEAAKCEKGKGAA